MKTRRLILCICVLLALFSSSIVGHRNTPVDMPPAVEGPLPRGPLNPFVIDMIGSLTSQNPADNKRAIRFHDVLENTTWHGHQAMRRETATTRPGGTDFVFWSSVVFDAKTLVPYASEARRVDGLFLKREFDGLHVKETRSTKDVLTTPRLDPGTPVETISLEFDLPELAYTWIENSGLPILLSLPLRDGLEGSVPVISGDSVQMKPCTAGPCHVLRMSYHVSGPEVITGLSAQPTKVWKIWVPETRFTFFLSQHKPRLEQVFWPGPGGTFSMMPVSPISQ